MAAITRNELVRRKMPLGQHALTSATVLKAAPTIACFPSTWSDFGFRHEFTIRTPQPAIRWLNRTANLVWFVAVFFCLQAIAVTNVSAPADDYLHFRRLTLEVGLPTEQVLRIFEDSRGFLWFGTSDGLARHDSHEFRVLRPNPKDPHSLENGNLSDIRKDAQGNLWDLELIIVPPWWRTWWSRGVAALALLAGAVAMGWAISAHRSSARLREAERERQVARERERAAAALGESEERLRLLGDNLPDSYVYQYTFKPDGTPQFLYLSAGVERLHGVKVSDALRDASVLHSQIDPEQAAAMQAEEATSLENLTDLTMELRMRRADGEWRWMQVCSRPRRVSERRVLWDGVATDITARKQAEAALRQREEQFRVIMENLADLVVVLDLEGRRLYNSPSYRNIFGDPDGLRGSSSFDQIHPHDRHHRRVPPRGLGSESL